LDRLFTVNIWGREYIAQGKILAVTYTVPSLSANNLKISVYRPSLLIGIRRLFPSGSQQELGTLVPAVKIVE